MKYIFLFLSVILLLSCNKDKDNKANTLINKLKARMWVLDSAVTIHADGSKSLYTPSIEHLEFVMFTEDMINYYRSANDTAYLTTTLYPTYTEPDTINIWEDVYQQGNPDNTFTIDMVTSQRLVYSFKFEERPGFATGINYYHFQ